MAAKKTVLVTGCSGDGIGEAFSLSFHKRGHRVIATARDTAKAKTLRDLGISVLPLDVTSESSIAEAVRRVDKETECKLDILINNAGVGYAMPVLDVELDVARDVFETNLFGRVAVTKAFAPYLIKSKGTIVNLGSINGVCPTPFSAMYNASYAAVHHWSDTLRLEMRPFDVKVILVITGSVKSNFLSNLPVKHLPPDSLYLPEAKEIEAGVNGEKAGGSTDTHVYADRVVSNILKSSPQEHQWVGLLATRIWMASTFLWATAWDLLLNDRFGLTSLKENMAAKEREQAQK
ncbi:NAD(P)-binding protein [Zopfia rhizophila CBS 207.26]|uniref:NAD(P)-binding protein n=1 Tax=Zopfia rhizophila CBS 207.26 TaxID=1314779 RepID=A0A6A6E5P5_9PEZI|nr:NAD(P)-binding protein [Zopfia rhizophila CBS 207.26]